MRRILLSRAAFIAGLVIMTSPAYAQRADENVTTSAEDGFGKSIGNESVGVYANGQVRGFSASDAGNARIEGIYYNENGGITDLLQSGSDIRVGLTAFGQPFPAPTGIVDTQLRRVTSDRTIVSARLSSGDYLGPDATIEAAIPLGKDVGVNTALGYFDEQYPDGASAWFISYGAVARYRPAKDTEVTALFSRYDYGDEEIGPQIFMAQPALPKRIERRIFFGQQWGQWSGHSQNYGGLFKTKRGNWRLEAGLFNSRFTQDDFASAWYDDVDANGLGQRYILSGQDQRFASTSGEVRIVRDVKDGKRLHRFIASVRGRNVGSDFGGYDLANLGPGVIGVADPELEPLRSYGPLTRDTVRQRSFSSGYELIWQGVGELNLGLTRSDYRKRVTEPGLASVSRRDRDWLWNAALAIPLNRDLTVYAATTRGLEESGTAPGNAANANQVLPALRTKQVEAGLRYRLTDKIRFAGAWFDLRKPYFEIDQSDNVYRILGEVRHRGVELSLSGEPVTGVSVVAGAVLLDPVVTGDAVDDGRLGRRPIGRTRTLVDASIDWTPAGQKAISLDLRLLYEGSRIADTLNRFDIPARITIDIGGRYRFKLGKSPATLRLKLANATNVYGWRVFGGGGFKANAPRRFSASITADF
jgi:iron complex outermembrane recepter protein